MRKLRVIVCGVGFGRYYIEAILRLPDLFELVGILSRGSKNSIKLAHNISKYNRTFWTHKIYIFTSIPLSIGISANLSLS